VDRRIRASYFCFEIRLFSGIFQQKPVAFRLIPAGNLLDPATEIIKGEQTDF
jgi:hypothetical protein